MSRLRRIFWPTPEETEADIAQYKAFFEDFKSKEMPKLQPCDDSGILRSEPFQHFYGDCETCGNYEEPYAGFITGGTCLKRNYIACGYGFTCDMHTSVHEGVEK